MAFCHSVVRISPRFPVNGDVEMSKRCSWSIATTAGAGGGLREFCYNDDVGLRLCTECLGSESCDGALEPEEAAAMEATDTCAVAAAGDEAEDEEDERRLTSALRAEQWEISRRRRYQQREFPPPLRWMAGDDGRPTGFIRAERKDGRLVLTESRIDRRPEVFRATREDGRLRLELIRSICYSDPPVQELEEEEEVEDDEEIVSEEERTSSSSSPMSTEEAEKDEISVSETEERTSTSSSISTTEELLTEWTPKEVRDQWRMREGVWRCQVAVGGNHEAATWWKHHRSFVTMA